MRTKANQEAPPHDGGFLSQSELLPRLGISRRTLANWRRRGLIPYVKLPGSRRLLFDWQNVKAALLRQEKGQP
jgi:predicted site-specific integrase-resolvase